MTTKTSPARALPPRSATNDRTFPRGLPHPHELSNLDDRQTWGAQIVGMLRDELGLDLDYTQVDAAATTYRAVGRAAQAWRAASTLAEGDAARQIVTASADPDAAAAVVLAAVRGTTPEERDAGARLFERADQLATRDYVAAVRALGRGYTSGPLWEALAAEWTASADRTIELAALVPDELDAKADRQKVHDLASATRHGVADAWLDLEAEHLRRDRLRRLINDLHAFGVWPALPRTPINPNLPSDDDRWAEGERFRDEVRRVGGFRLGARKLAAGERILQPLA